ncbi:shikimate kinase [Flavobacterium sp.]|uniref:shikimate kinase n=1 Tax=Flavobacterium sp. TaxID=239 RepID=UPI003526E5F4
MKIILVGYMASGKTTIGKQLSKIVSIPFYDLDAIIEAQEQKSIATIFKEKGEIYFRKIESEIANSFVKNTTNFILAFGGGTPCYANNYLLLQEEDVVSIYLNATVNTLTTRLEKAKANRPLLANLSNNELNDYVRKHLFDRSYFYNQSKIKIKTDEKPVSEIVAEIQQLLF